MLPRQNDIGYTRLATGRASIGIVPDSRLSCQVSLDHVAENLLPGDPMLAHLHVGPAHPARRHVTAIFAGLRDLRSHVSLDTLSLGLADSRTLACLWDTILIVLRLSVGRRPAGTFS